MHPLRILALCLFLLFLPVVSLQSHAAMPSVDNFIAPVQNDETKGIMAPTSVQKPEKLQIERITSTDGESIPVVQAASTQDAIIASLDELKKLQKDVCEIKVGSGIGLVATGIANYSTFPNRNASLIDKRQAYVKALLKAKANLASFLYGLSSEGKQELVESLDTYDNSQKSLANITGRSQESIDQRVAGLLRGYVIYSVNDDTEGQEVSVAIVTTPKTRGETMRLSQSSIEAADVASGMKEVFAELKTGVVPVSGGRLITTPNDDGTREFFFIGFGSAINKTSSNPTINRQLKLNMLKVAKARAASNLCGMIVGDDVMWNLGINAATSNENKMFDAVFSKENPTKEPAVKQLDTIKTSFVNRMKTTEVFSSARHGVLPPGLEAITWESLDNDWVYAAYIYNPARSLQAKAAAQSMTQGSILGRQKPHLNSKQDHPVPQGPTGQVSKDENL